MKKTENVSQLGECKVIINQKDKITREDSMSKMQEKRRFGNGFFSGKM
jgi:hypothetical protein